MFKKISVKFLGFILPNKVKKFFYKIFKLYNVFRILFFQFGFGKTVMVEKPIDREGDPIPWLSYPTIEFLKQIDMSEMSIFEYGSGFSSLFFSKKAKEIVSIENNREWFEEVQRMKSTNLKLLFADSKQEYINAIGLSGDKFDIVVVDGEYRKDCAQAAISHLKKGGIIILDNSDWHTKITAMLRENNFIQIDFNGFCPINGYTTTTSLFLDREVRIRCINDIQPAPHIGSLKQSVD